MSFSLRLIVQYINYANDSCFSLMLCRQTHKSYWWELGVATGSASHFGGINRKEHWTEGLESNACRVIRACDLIPKRRDWKYDEWLSIFHVCKRFSFFFASIIVLWMSVSDADEKLLSRFFLAQGKLGGKCLHVMSRGSSICCHNPHSTSRNLWISLLVMLRSNAKMFLPFFLVFRLRDKTRQAFSRIYHLGLINLGKFPFRLRLMFDFHSISLNDT